MNTSNKEDPALQAQLHEAIHRTRRIACDELPRVASCIVLPEGVGQCRPKLWHVGFLGNLSCCLSWKRPCRYCIATNCMRQIVLSNWAFKNNRYEVQILKTPTMWSDYFALAVPLERSGHVCTTQTIQRQNKNNYWGSPPYWPYLKDDLLNVTFENQR